MADNSPIRIYVNKIENIISFKIKTGYDLQLLTPQTIKLLGGLKSKTSNYKNGENVPHFEITEIVIICNNLDNDYEHDSRILYLFVPNKSFGQLLNISPRNLVVLNTVSSEFSYIEVW